MCIGLLVVWGFLFRVCVDTVFVLLWILLLYVWLVELLYSVWFYVVLLFV